MCDISQTLKQGTEITIGNVEFRLEEDVCISVLNVTDIDHAAQQCAIAGMPMDWTHYETTEDGRKILVQYGPQGDRIETAELALEEGEAVWAEIPITLQIPEDFELETDVTDVTIAFDCPISTDVEAPETVEVFKGDTESEPESLEKVTKPKKADKGSKAK